MSEFKTIETQEQLDAIIKERIDRINKATAEKYSGYMKKEDVDALNAKHSEEIAKLNKDIEEANGKGNDLATQIEALNSKVKGYERKELQMKVARDTGLPMELANKLSGDTEEELRADAKAFVNIVGKARGNAPAFNPEGSNSDTKREALRSMLPGLINN